MRSRSVNVSALADEEAGLDEAFESLFKPNAHWHPEARPRDWGDPEASLRQAQFWNVFDACLNHLPEGARLPRLLHRCKHLWIREVGEAS